jgi:formylglycine-generating enzyme required for sulfatase activity
MNDTREREDAGRAIERFVRRFGPDYRALVYYAALPLALTPELLHYLRHQFLPRTPWVAEVDLLLSELCEPAGYELYTMRPAVRAAALEAMRAQVGETAMQQVAQLLIEYVRLACADPLRSRAALQAQQWAAMAYLRDRREDLIEDLTRAWQRSRRPGRRPGAEPEAAADRAEMLRLARLVQQLAPQLAQYPALVAYAEAVTLVLTAPDQARPELLTRAWSVAGRPLPGLAELLTPATGPDTRPRAWTEPATGMQFVWIPPGRFQMGATEADLEQGYAYDDEQPQREVQIREGFWLGKYPVTQAQWQRVMDENPSRFNEQKVGAGWGEHPVDNVSWRDCQRFVAKLQQLNDRQPQPGPPQRGGESRQQWKFRLPSEAEWEYACRAGTATIWYFGDDEQRLADHAWYEENSEGQTHPVGQKTPNAWGLHDMLGNVWEWCADDWHDSYQGAPAHETPWGTLDEQKTKVVRGGAWHDSAKVARAACRNRVNPGLRNVYLGVRVVVGVERTL